MRKLVIVSLLVSGVASAQAWDKVKHTARAAARTGVDAVVDSARTVGETGKAMWHGGKPAASRAWHGNAAQEKHELRHDAADTKAAAH